VLMPSGPEGLRRKGKAPSQSHELAVGLVTAIELLGPPWPLRPKTFSRRGSAPGTLSLVWRIDADNLRPEAACHICADTLPGVTPGNVRVVTCPMSSRLMRCRI
jgi:hypothetical protein